MTLREQYHVQCKHARDVVAWGFGPREGFTLVAVKYPGLPARVSIIGGSIGWGSVDVWRMNGAHVHVIARVS